MKQPALASKHSKTRPVLVMDHDGEMLGWVSQNATKDGVALALNGFAKDVQWACMAGRWVWVVAPAPVEWVPRVGFVAV